MRNAPHSHRPFDGFSDDAVDRFLAGESTREEQERFQAYLARHIGDAAWTELFVAGEQRFASDVATGNARARLEARLRILGEDKAARKGMVFRDTAKYGVGFRTLRWGVFKTHPLRHWIWPMVAVMAVALWYMGGPLRRSQAASMLTYTTANGQRANITLPDGSTVSLNVASRLDVPADYVAGHRTVRLAGEALFTVPHHDGAPFTVIAGPVTVRVLGTSFVVRHYATDSLATVAVRDGKVAVRALVLTASQQAEIGSSGVAHVGQADASISSFATGVLMLNGVPLREAIIALDRWYNADIQLADPAIGARQVTGGFTAGSLSDLEETLEGTFNVRVERAGRHMTVFPR